MGQQHHLRIVGAGDNPAPSVPVWAWLLATLGVAGVLALLLRQRTPSVALPAPLPAIHYPPSDGVSARELVDLLIARDGRS